VDAGKGNVHTMKLNNILKYTPAVNDYAEHKEDRNVQ